MSKDERYTILLFTKTSLRNDRQPNAQGAMRVIRVRLLSIFPAQQGTVDEIGSQKAD